MTPQDILDRAYAKSKKNIPGRIVTEATEGLDLVNRVVRTFFQIGIRVNLTFYGDASDVAYSAPGWARPGLAYAVYRIEMADGTEVVTVPLEQKSLMVPKPSLFRFGQVWRSAGNANDPTNETLTFYYSKLPADAGALDAAIDSMWPTAYAELAALECALYMARKDSRAEEIPDLRAERDLWLRLYIAFLKDETVGVQQSYATPQYFDTDALVPIASLLIGGTDVELTRDSA